MTVVRVQFWWFTKHTSHPLNLIPRQITRDNTTLLLVTSNPKILVFVQPSSLISFHFLLQEFIANLCSLLWDIGPHYYKLKFWHCSFPNVVEQKFLNFNKLQSHGHKSKQLSIQTLSLKIDKLRLHLNQGYMNGTHMMLLRNIVKGIWNSLDKYIDYLKKQAVNVSKNHKTAVLPESKIEDFTIIKLKYHSYDDSAWEDRFLNIKNILSDTDFYVPVEINMHAFKDSGHWEVRHAIKTLIKKDFPYRFPQNSIYYFKLLSQGPHKAV